MLNCCWQEDWALLFIIKEKSLTLTLAPLIEEPIIFSADNEKDLVSSPLPSFLKSLLQSFGEHE